IRGTRPPPRQVPGGGIPPGASPPPRPVEGGGLLPPVSLPPLPSRAGPAGQVAVGALPTAAAAATPLGRMKNSELRGKIARLDREGEFASLRERHDMVLIGEGGEADTSIATAAKLARTLVELGVSAVVNLYDLSKTDKRKFVRIFLDALMSLPRSLWRPMIVV